MEVCVCGGGRTFLASAVFVQSCPFLCWNRGKNPRLFPDWTLSCEEEARRERTASCSAS